MKLVRIRGVCAAMGKSKSPLYLDQLNGTFPRGIKIGPRAAAWLESEIHQMIAARAAGASDAQLRQLVDKVHADRKKLMPELGIDFRDDRKPTKAGGA